MKTLIQIGALLFIIMYLLGVLLNFFQPKWYWKKFIPKLHEEESKHPVITSTVIILLIVIMMVGITSALNT
jgi:ABC-type multidrug transport system fused ATPase/permease subunit